MRSIKKIEKDLKEFTDLYNEALGPYTLAKLKRSPVMNGS